MKSNSTDFGYGPFETAEFESLSIYRPLLLFTLNDSEEYRSIAFFLLIV